MRKRIEERRLKPKAFISARTEDVQLHAHNLRALAGVVNRGINDMIAFGISLRCRIDELEQATVAVAGTDPYREKEVLTLRQAAHKLGTSVEMLRKDDQGRFPRPVRKAGNALMYARGDVDRWLAQQD